MIEYNLVDLQTANPTITEGSDYFLGPFHCLLFGVRHYLVFNSSATI